MIRILIADDEEIECRGLEMMLQNNFQDIVVLPSVYNGVDMVKCVENDKPDLLIADINMPGLNGLEALELLRGKAFDTKVIINTAYSDYEFIRQALLLGANDFLVKPVDEKRLVSAVARVLGNMISEKKEFLKIEEAQIQMKSMQKALGNELLSSILLGQLNVENFQIWLSNLGRVFQGGILVAVRLERQELLAQNQDAEKGENTPENGAKRLDDLLEHIGFHALEQLQRFCTLQYKVYKGLLYLPIFPGGQISEKNYRVWLEKLLERLQKEIAIRPGVSFVCGVSRWKEKLEKMTETPGECRAALKGNSEGTICFFEGGYSDSVYMDAKEIAGALACEHMSQVYESINRRITFLKEQEYSIEQIRMHLALFIQLCAELLNTEHRSGISWRRLLERFREKEEGEVLNAAVQMLEEIAEDSFRGKEYNSYVEEAVLYLEKNYRNDISLGEVAEKLGISSFYLSRLLTQELDRSFVELLTDIRIDHAIELLKTEDSIAKDIGKQVGYLSPNYFHKLFKKNTGMTVSEMRRLLKQQG